MKRGVKTALSMLALALLASIFATEASAQKYPERRMVRQGNEGYNKGEYTQSEIDYRRALETAPGTKEASFNLGNALYKQQRYEEAGKIYSELAKEGEGGAVTPASAHYNAGNALFQQQKLQEALEQYKEAIRKDPTDEQAKFNYAYVKKMLEQEQQDQENQDDQQDQEDQKDDQQDQDNQDQNQDQQDDQNQDQNKDDGQDDKNQDQNQDQQDDSGGEGDNDQKENDEKPQQSGQQPSSIDRQEAEQMLDAMQAHEDRTREKMDEKKVQAVSASGKNW